MFTSGTSQSEVKTRGAVDGCVVYSCTKHDGLVPSLEYFGKQVFSRNLDGYKRLQSGDFAYATNHIEEGSIGLLRDGQPPGLVSPMYTVFRPGDRVNPEFLFALLKTESYRRVFETRMSASVDRRGSLRWAEFSRIKIGLPSIDEQNRIAETSAPRGLRNRSTRATARVDRRLPSRPPLFAPLRLPRGPVMTPIPDTTPPFTEDTVSQLPALHLLQKLGWKMLTPAEALKLRGGKKGEVVLRSVLEQQLAAINEFEYRGQTYKFDASAIGEGIRALTDPGDDGLVRTNEKVWELLRYGKGVPQTVDGDTKSFQLRFVDWEHPERNVYHVSDEFAVESFGTTETRRPDAVLFVNGIPFAVIECKRPGGFGGEDPLDKAIAQQLRNQRDQEIPKLFQYAQVLFALTANQAKYGATGTSLPFWQGWREQVLPEAELVTLLKTPLSAEETERTFANDPHRFNGASAAVARTWLEGIVAAGRAPTEQDKLLWAIARPERLLALASRYTVFEAGSRKLARYQQYFAVEEILERVRNQDASGMRRGGLVWHTQGSGKSLTMVMLAESLLSQYAHVSPRIVLVTDRVDLDDQIYGTFVASGVAAEQAKTGRDLLEAPHGRADPGGDHAAAEVRGGGERQRHRARQSGHLRAGGRGTSQPDRPVPRRDAPGAAQGLLHRLHRHAGVQVAAADHRAISAG